MVIGTLSYAKEYVSLFLTLHLNVSLLVLVDRNSLYRQRDSNPIDLLQRDDTT